MHHMFIWELQTTCKNDCEKKFYLDPSQNEDESDSIFYKN